MLAPRFNRWGQVLLHFGTSPFEDSVKAVSGEMQHLRALRSFVRCSAPLASSKSAASQFEKAMLVSKLRGARERKRLAIGKCEGRKSWAEINPELVQQAKRLRRRSPKGHQRSLRDVAAELAKLGFVNERGVEFSAASVASMLGT
jgi:hypothetical protein